MKRSTGGRLRRFGRWERVFSTVQEFFDGLGERFHADRAEGLTAVYQFEITGADGGDWTAAIAAGQCHVAEGRHESPSVTVTCADSDWLDIVNGRLDPQMAFMRGKVRVQGDTGLALRLRSLFF